MNEKFEEYRDLVQLLQAAPKMSASEGFTERVINRLEAPKLGFWNLVRRVMLGSGQVKVAGIGNQFLNGQAPCFYFLIAGLFFFFIGATLLANLYYAPSINKFMLAQAILFLMTAVSLAATGLMLVARVPDAAYWAKRVVIVYSVLIMTNALLLKMIVKTALSVIFTLVFVAMGILMGMVLMSALKRRSEETAGHEQGGSNAQA
ncbi:MAG: hypothetical protein ABIE92_05310 [bacterium]